jgi:hypothetical protein
MTINKLPHTWSFARPRAKSKLGLDRSRFHDVITRQVPAHKLNALLAILISLVQEKLSLTLLVGLLAFHLASEVEK